MMARMPAALAVVLSLSAPPLVGIICGLVCTSDHQQPVQAAQHHHHTAPGGPHDEGAPVRLVGHHVCDHGLGVVDTYSPSTGWRSPLPSVTALAVSSPNQPMLTLAATPWGQPLERVLGPPTRSPVLRI